MLKVIFTMFILAAVRCALTSAFSKPCWDCQACTYTICMTEGNAKILKAVENQFALFWFQDIPDSIRQQCDVFSKRAFSCHRTTKRCRLSPNRSWDDRFNDTGYVRFLAAIGEYSCRDPGTILKLKSCATNTLEKLMRTCISGHYNKFNYTCARRHYTGNGQCDGQVDDFVEGLLSRYIHVNPYINESS